MTRVLVLGGTNEGRLLAAKLVSLGIEVVSSLAGRVSSPRLPEGETRIGGFGGTDGLIEYLKRENVSAIVDATHPFAAGMTANAAAASQKTGKPLLILHRPAWQPTPEDHWTSVHNLTEAAARIVENPETTNVLLTTGRQETAAFTPLPQRFWLRAVEPPEGPLPRHCEIILDRGPFTLPGERKLLQENDIAKIVTKNSGGPMTAAKLAAARERGLEVIMVERPPLPAGVPVAPNVALATSWVQHI
jgi:precorrin-6A/cobalt-precorrin-6A reductase